LFFNKIKTVEFFGMVASFVKSKLKYGKLLNWQDVIAPNFVSCSSQAL